MSLITTTKPVPPDSVCSTEPTTSAVPSAETVQPEVLIPAEKMDQKDQQPASSDKDIATLSTETPAAESELPEATESQLTVQSNTMETDNDAPVEESQPLLSVPPPSVEVPLPKPRKFVARVQGLPATTLEVFPDKVLVKHPFNPEEVVNFDSVDNAKVWLQTLALQQELICSEQSKRSNSPDDSNTKSNDEEVVECGQNATQKEDEPGNVLNRPSSTSAFPQNSSQRQKRVRRVSYQVMT